MNIYTLIIHLVLQNIMPLGVHEKYNHSASNVDSTVSLILLRNEGGHSESTTTARKARTLPDLPSPVPIQVLGF